MGLERNPYSRGRSVSKPYSYAGGNPAKKSVAGFMGFFKGKSSILIRGRHGYLKYKYGSRNFWCRGYFVDTVGKNAKMIQEYIQNQLEEDLASDQISLKEYMDPFTGSKRK